MFASSSKKIESHPHRQDLQADQQQNNAYNPFSEKSKKMIQDMGNVELFELCETPHVTCPLPLCGTLVVSPLTTETVTVTRSTPLRARARRSRASSPPAVTRASRRACFKCMRARALESSHAACRAWRRGLPLAVVKQAENFRVRELVKKIESHPHRQDLQADQQRAVL